MTEEVHCCQCCNHKGLLYPADVCNRDWQMLFWRQMSSASVSTHQMLRAAEEMDTCFC